MSEIEAIIRETLSWLNYHRTCHRQIEAMATAIRLHALIDAYEAVGGNGSQWRKECGVLK